MAFQIKEEVAPSKIKAMQTVASEVFGKKSFEADNDEQRAAELRKLIVTKYQTLKGFEDKTQDYPGHVLLQKGLQLLRPLTEMSDSGAFYDYISKHKDDLLDWNDDFLDDGIRDFYYSQSMQDIWDKGLNALRVYGESSDFLSDNQLQDTVDKMAKLLHLQKLQGDTAVKISELNKQFDELFSAAFDKTAAGYLADIDDFRERGLTRIEESAIPDQNVKDKLAHDFENRIKAISEAATDATTLNEVVAKPAQASAQLDQLTDRINHAKAQLIPAGDHSGESKTDDKHKDPDKPVGPTVVSPQEKIVKLEEVLHKGDYKITASADIDKLTAQFKRSLEAQLSDNTVVTLQID